MNTNQMVQCSQDSGATWSAPLAIANPIGGNSFYPTGAISPGGNVAIAWLDNVNEPGGATAEVFIAISSDKGKTFAPPVHHPTIGGDDTQLPVLGWENDSVLWLEAQTGANNEYTFVDKTCDNGQSWSGAVALGETFHPNGLFLTAKGMSAGLDETHNLTAAFVIPLSGQ